MTDEAIQEPTIEVRWTAAEVRSIYASALADMAARAAELVPVAEAER